ncbi:Inner membrane transport permease YbhR [Actinomadura rubteroloni]|uniref:Inner membrane transport permease YbhR n=1 Tax=Actinomadura rubteroloni TaxID=1926885 RepID=A0A2P4UCD0_9ACTN|nr:ABC transporter permease [Actinomadura rubteroloni]POM22692.1 Inner membrane transport permease YbhR [Actinomadura rubteroloni]
MSTWQSFRSLARAMFLGFRRDRGALFFTVLFPLMFLVVFGGVFGHQTSSKVDVIEIGAAPLIDGAVAHDADLRKTMKVTRYATSAAALRKVEKGDAAAAVEQRDGTLVVHYSAADQVKAGTVRGLLGAVVQAANQEASGRPPTYRMSDVQVEDDSLKAIQFFTPSLLGWALASAGVFGASQTLVTWRTKGMLRRLRLSPAPIATVFGARVAVSLAVAMVQLGLFLAVAQLPVFGLKLMGAWWMAIPSVVAGVLAFLGIGMLIGAWAKTQESAQSMTQLVVLPMAFLGGSFFPLDDAPVWMRTLSYVFPLRYLNEAMLNVMGRGLGPASALPQIGVLLGVAAVTAFLASRLFRWDAS